MTRKRIFIFGRGTGSGGFPWWRFTHIPVDDDRTVKELWDDVKECVAKPRITFRWPTNYKVVTQAFRNNPAYYGQFKCGKEPFRKALPGHEGIDMRAYDGSPILAVYDGEVIVKDEDEGGAYGKQVRIESMIDGEIYRHTYAHLKGIPVGVVREDWVVRGQTIGYADSTGNSTGSHLHFMLKMVGATERGLTDYPCDIINPEPFFAELR